MIAAVNHGSGRLALVLYKELLQTAEQVPPTPESKDRRRPGRNDQASPHLIPLLRNSATVDIPVPLSGEVDAPPLEDDLAPLRGIFLSLALGVPSWVWVAGITWAVLR